MKTLHIEIGDHDKIKSRSIVDRAKLRITKNKTRMWYDDFSEFARMFTKTNLAVLNHIKTFNPKSVEELAAKVGCRKCDLSRAINTLAKHSFIELKKVGQDQFMPILHYDNITATMVVGSL